jgi:Arc/MetJ-type ribon-helix-helix transcriptional regulator
MNTPLTPKIERLIEERVQSGSYQSATEVIEDAFAALAEREDFHAICAELEHADGQIASGEYTEYNENTIQRLAERVKARGQARLAEERARDTR